MYDFDDSMIYHSSGISYGLWLDIRDVADAAYEYGKGKPVGLIIDALVESGFVHDDDIKDHWREYQLFHDQDIHEFAREVNQILGNGINVGAYAGLSAEPEALSDTSRSRTRKRSIGSAEPVSRPSGRTSPITTITYPRTRT